MKEPYRPSKGSGKKRRARKRETPPEMSGSVTAEMLAKLPPQAIAAWAGRCALRVQPLIRAGSFGSMPPQEVANHIEALDVAVTLTMVPETADIRFAFVAAKAAAEAAANAVTNEAASAATFAVARAAVAAAHAAEAAAMAKAGAIAGAVDAAVSAGYSAVKASAYDDADSARVVAAAYDDYEHLVKFQLDLETFFTRPFWPMSEPKGWRDIVSSWGEELDSLASQFSELQGLYKRYVRLLEGNGLDREEARERIDGWLKRYQKRKGDKTESDEDSSESEKQDKRSDDSVAQSRETPAPDRRGAPTSTLDAPTTDDTLDRRPLVQSLAAMFAAPQQATPFTLALLGDWGAGKSSVMDQLAEELKSGKYGEGELEFLFAKFNTWQYEHTDDIRAGLAHEVVSGLTNDLGVVARWSLKIRFACAEHPWEFLRTLGGLLVAVCLAGSVFWAGLWDKLFVWTGLWDKLFAGNWSESLAKPGVFSGAAIAAIYLWKTYKPVFDHPLTTKLQTYLKLPDYGKHLGLVPVMKKHIKTICQLRGVKRKNATKRLVVFIDDLDRCGHECITQTFDAVRLVMDIPNVIVVIAIDYRIAFAAVANHYAELADDDRSKEDIARDYLGKIIQLPVELAKPQSMRKFIRERLFPTADEEETDRLARDKEFQSLDEMSGSMVDAAEEREAESAAEAAKTPQEGERRQDGVEDAAPSVEPASVQSSQVSDDDDLIPQLMAETPLDCRFFEFWTGNFKFTNPRQLIRLRNSYRLLTQLEHVRGTGDSDKQRMAMLFWLELLHQKSEAERKQYEDVLNRDFVLTIDVTQPDLDRISKEITHLGIRSQIGDGLDADTENRRLKYASLKTRVSRFVLPAMCVRSGAEKPSG